MLNKLFIILSNHFIILFSITYVIHAISLYLPLVFFVIILYTMGQFAQRMGRSLLGVATFTIASRPRVTGYLQPKTIFSHLEN